jgi:hypothetical protein
MYRARVPSRRARQRAKQAGVVRGAGGFTLMLLVSMAG